jgi:hypothetical protein
VTQYNRLNDFEVRGKAMTPAEAGGRALHRIEHPSAHPNIWEDTDDNTRAWWVNKAQTVTDAVLAAGRR